MKKFMLAALSACCLLLAIEATAVTTAGECMNKTGCSVTISDDTGSGKQCTNLGGICECEWQSCQVDYYVSSTTGCTTGYTHKGATILGKGCCHRSGPCPPASAKAAKLLEMQEQALQFDVETTASGGLDHVFDTNHTMTDVYWGVVNSLNRSPSGGRTVAARAKLDACLFYSDVDAIDSLGGTEADKYNNCAGSTYGCASTMKNEHCQANSAAVCVDRCACVYSGNGIDTCNGL